MGKIYYWYGDSKRNDELKKLIKDVCPNVDFNDFGFAAEENLYYVINNKVEAVDATSQYSGEIVDLVKSVGTEIKLGPIKKLVPVTKYQRVYNDPNGQWLDYELFDTLDDVINTNEDYGTEVTVGYKPVTVHMFVEE